MSYRHVPPLQSIENGDCRGVQQNFNVSQDFPALLEGFQQHGDPGVGPFQQYPNNSNPDHASEHRNNREVGNSAMCPIVCKSTDPSNFWDVVSGGHEYDDPYKDSKSPGAFDAIDSRSTPAQCLEALPVRVNESSSSSRRFTIPILL
ncbi:unnamed protein product [Calypogeia fissa]